MQWACGRGTVSLGGRRHGDEKASPPRLMCVKSNGPGDLHQPSSSSSHAPSSGDSGGDGGGSCGDGRNGGGSDSFCGGSIDNVIAAATAAMVVMIISMVYSYDYVCLMIALILGGACPGTLCSVARLSHVR